MSEQAQIIHTIEGIPRDLKNLFKTFVNKFTQKAVDLIASGKVNVDFMVTHHFPLEQTKDAFELVAGYRDGVIKAMISM